MGNPLSPPRISAAATSTTSSPPSVTATHAASSTGISSSTSSRGLPVSTSSRCFPTEFSGSCQAGRRRGFYNIVRIDFWILATRVFFSFNPFDDADDEEEVEKRLKPSFKNHFRESGGVENQTVQELESYAVYKSDETTKTVQGCLKVAQGIR
ncbi:unnamed protein product [Brassica oleracea]